MVAADRPARSRRHLGNDEPLSLFDAVTRRNSIRGILLVIVLAAFLPTLGLALWQGVARLDRDAEAGHRQLALTAAMISHSEVNVIADSHRVLAVLASLPAVNLRVQPLCGPVLAEAVARFPGYEQIWVSGPDGRRACASDARTIGLRFADANTWDRLAGGGFLVTAPVARDGSRTPALHAILPLLSPSGAFDGAITASIDLEWLRRVLVRNQDGDAVAVAIVDGEGHPIVRSAAFSWANLDMPAAGAGGETIPVLDTHDGKGTRWSYAVAPLHTATNGGENLFIVYAAAQPARFGTDWWFAAGYFVLPLLALVLAAGAIWFAANRAILRWVWHLAALTRQIGIGDGTHLQFRSRFADAPSEMRDLAAELLRVGNAITDREQRLRRSATAQADVARELHHRVRHNLQVMASFLSLQAQSLPGGPARVALEAANLRVATMAMVNGLLYADAEVSTVTLADILDPIADLLAPHIGIDADVSVEPLLASRKVDIDRAMPMSLWIVEATVCLFERIDPDRKPGLFTIGIATEDDSECVIVMVRGPLLPPLRQSLHHRLVTAIAHQLGGVARIDEITGAGAKVVLCLPIGELTGGSGLVSDGIATEIAA